LNREHVVDGSSGYVVQGDPAVTGGRDDGEVAAGVAVVEIQ
jgi:hypothetical protein